MCEQGNDIDIRVLKSFSWAIAYNSGVCASAFFGMLSSSAIGNRLL